jgi:hypothetical protein
MEHVSSARTVHVTPTINAPRSVPPAESASVQHVYCFSRYARLNFFLSGTGFMAYFSRGSNRIKIVSTANITIDNPTDSTMKPPEL